MTVERGEGGELAPLCCDVSSLSQAPIATGLCNFRVHEVDPSFGYLVITDGAGNVHALLMPLIELRRLGYEIVRGAKAAMSRGIADPYQHVPSGKGRVKPYADEQGSKLPALERAAARR